MSRRARVDPKSMAKDIATLTSNQKILLRRTNILMWSVPSLIIFDIILRFF